MNKFGYRFIKRLFDLCVGLVASLFLIPIALFIKILYLATGDRASIFLPPQERLGKGGKVFKFFKFRTMVPGADDVLKQLLKDNPKLRKEYQLNKKLVDDPRITKGGRLVRHFSLDETPQFLHVLFGQMSLIGNRPYLKREEKDMGELKDLILSTKPGITGLWQTAGHNNVSFKSRLELEAIYSETCSLSLDCKIFFRTFGAVFNPKDGKKAR